MNGNRERNGWRAAALILALAACLVATTVASAQGRLDVGRGGEVDDRDELVEAMADPPGSIGGVGQELPRQDGEPPEEGEPGEEPPEGWPPDDGGPPPEEPPPDDGQNPPEQDDPPDDGLPPEAGPPPEGYDAGTSGGEGVPPGDEPEERETEPEPTRLVVTFLVPGSSDCRVEAHGNISPMQLLGVSCYLDEMARDQIRQQWMHQRMMATEQAQQAAEVQAMLRGDLKANKRGSLGRLFGSGKSKLS